ncbi:MAG: hypothetical protein WCC11_03595 [Gammaproteobacteria bacterium]
MINADPATSRVSYNGGEGGTRLQATASQLSYAREQHVAPTTLQLQQERLALNNPEQRFAVNQGRPQIAATARPGVFQGAGVVRINPERNGYVYRPGAHNTASVRPRFQNTSRNQIPDQPALQNGVNAEAIPQARQDNPDDNAYRRAVRPAGNNHATPVRVTNPRPTPPPAEPNKERRPQPPVSFGNPYASAYPMPARADASGWNENRSEAPRPEQFQAAPSRQVFQSAPRATARAPSGNSGQSHTGDRSPR